MSPEVDRLRDEVRDVKEDRRRLRSHFDTLVLALMSVLYIVVMGVIVAIGLSDPDRWAGVEPLESVARIMHRGLISISEAARSDLYTGLSEVLGPERAETLMSAIPLHDLDEIAAKGDIAELRAELVTGQASLRAEFKSDFFRLTLVLVAGFLGVIATLIGVS